MKTDPAGDPCRQPNKGPKLFPAETHCHTRETGPCGRVPADYLVKAYLQENYRYLFITDHMHEKVMEDQHSKDVSWEARVDTYLKGYRTAKKAAQDTGLVVMLAMEVTLKGQDCRDFLVYGADENFLYQHPFFYCCEYEDFYKLVQEHGFLSFQAHPYRYGGKPIEPVCYDGIEIFNAHPRHLSQNHKAMEYATEKGLYMIAGSDVHAEEDIARGGVMLPDGIGSGADFVRFIKESGSPELIITFQ